MRRVMSILAKAGLVELSEEERAALDPHGTAAQSAAVLPEADEASTEPAPILSSAPTAETLADFDEGRPFDDLYAAANLPSSPFPAERLLRLLDGLRAMDPSTRKTAVLAMDQADEAWQIADPVLDAQRKIAVLESHKQSLSAYVGGRAEDTARRCADERERREQRAAEIRRQIAELEQLLEREAARSAEAIAGLEAELQADREAADRETRRIDAEIERLREIPRHFASPADDA